MIDIMFDADEVVLMFPKQLGSSEEEFLEVFYSVLKRVSFYDEQTITEESKQKAYDLCRDLDEKDTPSSL